MHQRFEYNQIEGVVLADKNYTLRPFVMIPVEQPSNINEWQYNQAHRKCYIIPKAIDVWKRRFKCLQTILNNKEGILSMIPFIGDIALKFFSETIQSIITACAVLHNIAIQRKLSHSQLSKESENNSAADLHIKPNADGTNTVPKRKYAVDMVVMQEPLGLLDREHFIQKYFGCN